MVSVIAAHRRILHLNPSYCAVVWMGRWEVVTLAVGGEGGSRLVCARRRSLRLIF